MTDLDTRVADPVEPPKRQPPSVGLGFWLKLLGLAILDSLAIYAFVVFFAEGDWMIGALLVAIVLFINWAYLSPRSQALRWILPGATFTLIFLAIPIIFTAYISITNWSTGNSLTKPQAIEVLESAPFVDPDDPGRVLDLYVFQDPQGSLLFFAVDLETGEAVAGTPRQKADPPSEGAVYNLESADVVDGDGDGVPEQIDSYELLTGPALFRVANEIQSLVLDLPDGEAVPLGTNTVRVVTAGQRYVYDEATDSMFDNAGDEVCPASGEIGKFICPGDRAVEPGWRVIVGLENYKDILTDTRIRGPILRVFVWNVVFALGTVLLTFGLGLGLAIVLGHPRVRGKVFYRSMYILPYAIPAFLSILIWRGLLNATFGPVNNLLNTFGIPDVPWLTDPTWAKVALLLVNTWLGFTYMYLISTGALAAIPAELEEAARVDGASGWQVFRRITFPLLMVALAPLLIGSFAFNFNNFIIVEFLTNGGPPILDAAVPVGATDILITFTFNVAVAAGRGNQFGVGSAITLLIFFVLVVISSISFRFTRRLEDIYGGS
jgi:arabinogalactan oligomer/maltooligosaccharide transport system permease protein